MAKFYITGLYHTAEFNDMTLPPIEVEADNRIEALTRIRATVWTEEEFQEMRSNPFMLETGGILDPVRAP